MATLVPQSHPALHTITEEVPVEEITTARIQKVIKDMRSALRTYRADGFTGVAIAAPQIGVPLRIFLVEDMSAESGAEPRLPSLVAINPQLVRSAKKKTILSEGCLSVPDLYGTVERAVRATIRAYDERGESYERGGGGLLAQVFQHEIDHLDGILFVDRATAIMHKEELEAAPEEA